MSVAAITPPLQSSAPEPDAAEVRLALDHVLASVRFSRSPRLRRFLEFIVRRKLAGQAGGLKEYVIATEVYDRGAAFNPAADTIVRVEARRLRAMLQAYYDNDAVSDAIRIDVPKGGYEPSFRRRPPVQRRPMPTRPHSSVAVAPFRDLSGDRQHEYLCRGLTEEVVCALTQVEGLRVAGPTVGAPATPSSSTRIVDEATPRYHDDVVGGTVRHSDTRVRITAQLTSADGYHLWSQRFERELKDPFTIQDEVAAAVVEAVRERRLG